MYCTPYVLQGTMNFGYYTLEIRWSEGKVDSGTFITRSSESDGRSDVTDCLDCPDLFRLPWFI